MKRTTISIPEKLLDKVKHKVEEEGYMSMNDYILFLVREDTKGMVVPQVQQRQFDIPQPTIPQQFIQPPPLPLQRPSVPEEIATDAPTRIPLQPAPQPLHPKMPLRDPNKPDPYLVYGGKCQYKTINAGNVMCLYAAAKKLSVARNQTGEQPAEEQYQDVYLCPDHSSEVSHRGGFFVK